MKFETAFHRAWGRPPTRAEVASVERVCNAFEVRDNDALKAIAGLLEYYHSHLRMYPGQCTMAVQQWLGSPDGAESLARAMRAASSSGVPPSPGGANGSRTAAAPRHEVPLAALATASSAISGALGMLMGSALSGRPPVSVPRGAVDLVPLRLLGAPMGWIFLLPVLGAAYFGAAWGWRRGIDRKGSIVERGIGWTIAAASSAFVLVCGALITRLMLDR